MKKILGLIMSIVVVIITVYLVASGNPPEFFDIFGLVVFAFLLFVGIKMVKKKKLPDWTGFVILLIAILGLIIDGYIVIKTYIIGG